MAMLCLNLSPLTWVLNIFHLRRHHPSEERSQCQPKLCARCIEGPFSRPSLRKIVGGTEVTYSTTRHQIKAGLDSGYGLCRLLVLTIRTRSVLEGDSPPPDDIEFRLSITAETVRDGFRSVSPQGVQSLNVAPDRGYPKSFYLYTTPDNPAADEIIARTPILEVGSSFAFAQALKCVQHCVNEHVNCPKPGSGTSPLPTRVIDCKHPSRPRLHISNGASAPYIALSYVWGGPQLCCTTTSNVNVYSSRKGIKHHNLPPTIRDAIQVTFRLGFRYLWVDALCIIQDSTEDKIKELTKMGSIYRDAYLTIIASNASSANAGFLQNRSMQTIHADHPQLPFHCNDGRMGFIFAYSQGGPAETYEPLNEPVNTRAWCLQERLLSPRKLVYATDNLQYHCQTALCDVGDAVSGKPIGEQLNDIIFTAVTPEDVAAQLAIWVPAQWQSLHEDWRMIVSNYTNRGLTNERDKLPAFSGVAEQFHRIWGESAGRYLAGIWERLLPDDLLWKRTTWSTMGDGSTPPDSLRPRLTKSGAPSWSWTSVDGHVSPDATEWDTHHKSEDDATCEVLRCDITLEDELLPFGGLALASLVLRASVVPTPWISLLTDGSGPERYLSLYSSTEALLSAASSQGREGIVVGVIPEEVADADKDAETPLEGRKVLLQLDESHGQTNLMAFDSAMESDPSLLKYMGDVSIFFDGPEHIPANQAFALVIKRFVVDSDRGAEGLLVACVEEGKYKRFGSWISLVQLRGGDRAGDSETVWFERSERCMVELI